MKTLTYAALLLLVLTFIAGCKKDDDETTAPTNKELLTSTTWKALYLNSNGTNVDPFCWKNSIYSYQADGNLIYVQGDDEGACSGTMPGTASTFNWYFVDDDTKFVRIDPDYPAVKDTFEILSVSENELRVKQVVNSGASIWITTLLPL